MLDRHFYQCFADADKALDLPGHLQKCTVDWQHDVATLQLHKPVIAGEWSLALDGDVTPEARTAYAKAQLATLEQTAAWFFWTYKTEDSPEWDLRRCATLLGLKPT
jgi:glucan 1,3-beta-glucosidase